MYLRFFPLSITLSRFINKGLYAIIYINIIQNIPKLQTMQMPFNWWKDKGSVLDSYSGMQLSNEMDKQLKNTTRFCYFMSILSYGIFFFFTDWFTKRSIQCLDTAKCSNGLGCWAAKKWQIATTLVSWEWCLLLIYLHPHDFSFLWPTHTLVSWLTRIRGELYWQM